MPLRASGVSNKDGLQQGQLSRPRGFCSLTEKEGFGGTWVSLPPLVSLGCFQHLGAKCTCNPDVFLHKSTTVCATATLRLEGRFSESLIILRSGVARAEIPLGGDTPQIILECCGRRWMAFPHLFSQGDAITTVTIDFKVHPEIGNC